MLVEILKLANYKVITANNGKEGVFVATSKLPDIILCDILMPEMDGYDVIKQMKTNPATAKIPFIYVTASTENSDIKLALNMGAGGYVRKPFDVRELMETINSALER